MAALRNSASPFAQSNPLRSQLADHRIVLSSSQLACRKPSGTTSEHKSSARGRHRRGPSLLARPILFRVHLASSTAGQSSPTRLLSSRPSSHRASLSYCCSRQRRRSGSARHGCCLWSRRDLAGSSLRRVRVVASGRQPSCVSVRSGQGRGQSSSRSFSSHDALSQGNTIETKLMTTGPKGRDTVRVGERVTKIYSFLLYQSSKPRSVPKAGVLTRCVLPFLAASSSRVLTSSAVRSTVSRLEAMRSLVTDLGRTTTPRATWYEMRTLAGWQPLASAIALMSESPSRGESEIRRATGQNNRVIAARIEPNKGRTSRAQRRVSLHQDSLLLAPLLELVLRPVAESEEQVSPCGA